MALAPTNNNQPLIVTAQILPQGSNMAKDKEEDPAHVHLDDDLVVYEGEEPPTEEQVLEVHEEPEGHAHSGEPHGMQVMPMEEIQLVLPRIPGAPNDAQDDLTVSDAEVEIDEHKQEEKHDPWDYSKADNFMAWISDRFNNVPKHSGNDIAGCDRALSYLDNLKSKTREAMRNDYNGAIDANMVEEAMKHINNGIGGLTERLETLEGKKRTKKRASGQSALVKEGQKATHVGGIIVTVPMYISRIARICINGSVSGGHDIEDLFGRLVKKYSLTERDQAETMQLLADMGYPLRRDRGYMIDEDFDSTSSDNMDWAANYPGQ
jgi:hypothetical protein